MATKLEQEMDKRAAKDRAIAKEAKEKADKMRLTGTTLFSLFVRQEFNRVFKRLCTLVEGHWDPNGWGWTFKYRDRDFWISYDSWEILKTPGDPDDYDMRGYHWILKDHHISLDNRCYVLGDSNDPRNEKKDFTELVLQGLKVLSKE